MELLDEDGFTHPLRATYLDQGLYGTPCLCKQMLVFPAEQLKVKCDRCGRLYEVTAVKAK